MILSIEQIASKFLPEHVIESIEPLGNGLINETLLVTANKNSESKKIVLQKINASVYPSPEILVRNHAALISQISEEADCQKRIISDLLRTVEGKYFFLNGKEYWRAQSYIKNTISHDEVVNELVAFEGAKIVGRFNSTCSIYKNIRLTDPINGFHNLEFYLKLFQESLIINTDNRLSNCSNNVAFIDTNKDQMLKLFALSQKLPQRVCHYDTKINNILFDQTTNKAVQIVDLDNVMYGKVIFDFGDMMRTFISPADENEKELNKVKIRWKIVGAMIKGYLSEARNILTPEEKSMLISGGILITYEQTVRFLTDYLIGDRYYKIEYPDHNLIRAKNQIHLVQLFLKHQEELEHFMLNS